METMTCKNSTRLRPPIVALAIAVTMSGCGGPDSGDPPDEQAAISGVDANANGVRDSVESAIQATYADDPKKAELATATATQAQGYLAPVPETAALAQTALTSTADRLRCARGAVPSSEVEVVTMEAQRLTYDSAERLLRADQLRNKAGLFELDQSKWPDPDAAKC